MFKKVYDAVDEKRVINVFLHQPQSLLSLNILKKILNIPVTPPSHHEKEGYLFYSGTGHGIFIQRFSTGKKRSQ